MPSSDNAMCTRDYRSIERLESRECLTASFATADFNADQRVDAQDIDLLASAISSNDVDFDLTSDGQVNKKDLDYLIEDLIRTRPGDANLDGDVDFADFLTVADNFGEEGGWAAGNFDLEDPAIHFRDFLLMTVYFGFNTSMVSYTHHGLDGNRYVDGWADVPGGTPIEIPLSFQPSWILGMLWQDDEVWTAVSANGAIEAFRVADKEVTAFPLPIDKLPADSPPALVKINGELLIDNSIGDTASATSHPVRYETSVFPSSSDLQRAAYIREDGYLVLEQQDAPFSSPREFNIRAMRDARILSDELGRLLVLSNPTTRLTHGVLGDSIEANRITLVDPLGAGTVTHIETPPGKVVEGIAPIWFDIDNDGQREIIVTLSSSSNGGQITVYEEDGSIAAQEPGIGIGSRWRHPIAVAPFGPNQELELVTVLTPHIGGVAEFRALEETLTINAQIGGITSHTIRSRNLDLAVAGDFDADGIVELLAPSQRRDKLHALTRTDTEAIVDWEIDLNGSLTTNIGTLRHLNGRISVAVGTSSSVLTIFRS